MAGTCLDMKYSQTDEDNTGTDYATSGCAKHRLNEEPDEIEARLQLTKVRP